MAALSCFPWHRKCPVSLDWILKFEDGHLSYKDEIIWTNLFCKLMYTSHVAIVFVLGERESGKSLILDALLRRLFGKDVSIFSNPHHLPVDRSDELVIASDAYLLQHTGSEDIGVVFIDVRSCEPSSPYYSKLMKLACKFANVKLISHYKTLSPELSQMATGGVIIPAESSDILWDDVKINLSDDLFGRVYNAIQDVRRYDHTPYYLFKERLHKVYQDQIDSQQRHAELHGHPNQPVESKHLNNYSKSWRMPKPTPSLSSVTNTTVETQSAYSGPHSCTKPPQYLQLHKEPKATQPSASIFQQQLGQSANQSFTVSKHSQNVPISEDDTNEPNQEELKRPKQLMASPACTSPQRHHSTQAQINQELTTFRTEVGHCQSYSGHLKEGNAFNATTVCGKKLPTIRNPLFLEAYAMMQTGVTIASAMKSSSVQLKNKLQAASMIRREKPTNNHCLPPPGCARSAQSSCSNMYRLVEEVLSSIGHAELRLTTFKNNGISDNFLKMTLANKTDPKILRELIPVAIRRQDFIRAFRERMALDETIRPTPTDMPSSSSSRTTAEEDLAAHFKRTLDMKEKQNEVAVKLALPDAKEYYQAQMQSTRQAKRWYPSAEFKKINDSLLSKTVQKSQQEESLTSEQAKSLKQALRGLYLKFQQENDSQPGQSYAIGIDLGTTHSCVGVYREGRVDIMRQNELFTVPSCVFFEEDGSITVGEAALDGAYRSPEDFIYDAKRLIGRNYNDAVVQDDIKHWSFNVVSELEDQSRIVCRGKQYRPEEISSKVLAHLKTMAQRHLDQDSVTNAVVTVPAYFNEGQRQATKDAAEMAGLTATILTEPVAAAIAYGFHWNVEFQKNVLVFDLGGGTFDVAILRIERGNIDVKTINGDTHLGGEDFDNEMVKFIIGKLKAGRGIDLYKDKGSPDQEVRKRTNNLLRRLKVECERKKRELSYSNVASIRLEDIRMDEKISRDDFEALIMPCLRNCIKIVEKALLDAKMDKKEIAEVILVGGSTKIPKVREMLKDFFDDSRQIRHTIDPDQAVAYGASILAAITSSTNQGEDVKGIISVSDVTPFSIGAMDANGKYVVLIPKNSKMPISSENNTWRATYDNHVKAVFFIYEGENPVAKENHLLGSFMLDMPPMPKEKVKVKTETLVDAEGIVTVKAICLTDGNSSDIRIDTYKGRMSRAEIEERRNSNALRWK